MNIATNSLIKGIPASKRDGSMGENTAYTEQQIAELISRGDKNGVQFSNTDSQNS